MKKFKRALSVLTAAVLICCSLSAMLPSVSAQTLSDGTINTADTPQVLSGSAPVTYKDTFSEDFENGLDNWEETGFQKGYTGGFKIVDAPTAENPENKALTFTNYGAALTPTDAVWPVDGTMQTVTFKLKFNSLNYSNKGHAGIMVLFKDAETFNGFFTVVNYNGVIGLWGKQNGITKGDSITAGGGPQPGQLNMEDWLTVTINYTEQTVTLMADDNSEGKNATVSMSCSNNALDAKFGVGNPFYGTGYGNRSLITENYDLAYTIDDIKITYRELDMDKDIEQKDVNVYYSGNTFLNPGDTVNIIGEQFADVVDITAGVDIKKLPDTALTGADNAFYINEDAYDKNSEENITWDAIPSVAEATVDIVQYDASGIKVILPTGKNGENSAFAEKGMYALRVKSAKGGKDGIVIVNNPSITLSSGDDGAEATSGGWVRLAGENLSVQNDISKVSAIIINKQTNERILLDNSAVYADTTENNGGKENEYFLKVTLPTLADGEYQIITHNGYGGDIGWSMPKDFTVKQESEREKWHKIGTFDVTDFGAVGDGAANDTGAILLALAAAEEAGGGIVYFPKIDGQRGIYRFTETLYVPDSVSLIGEGTYDSVLYFDIIHKVYMPDAAIMYEGNFEINNICLTGSATAKILWQDESLVQYNCSSCGETYLSLNKKEEKCKECSGDIRQTERKPYVYLENFELMFDSMATIDGHSSRAMLEGWTLYTLTPYIYIESFGDLKNDIFGIWRNYCYNSFTYANNVIFYQPNGGYSGNGMLLYTDYGLIENVDFVNARSHSKYTSSNALFFEDSVIKSGNMAGYSFYKDIDMGNVTQNNREIFCTDGHSNYYNRSMQDLNDVGTANGISVEELLENELEAIESEADKQKLKEQVTAYIEQARGRVYRLTTPPTWYMETYSHIYITEGQGAGQVRRLENNNQKIGNYTYITVDEPFTVSPNRNSMVYIYGSRAKVFVTNCSFKNGRHVGPYGTMVDAVYDGNKWRRSSSGIEIRANSGLIWYLTSKNSDVDDVITYHSTKVTTYPSGMQSTSAAVSRSYFGIAFRENVTGQYGFYQCASFQVRNPVLDIIFENNIGYSDGDPLIQFLNGDGVWCKGNKQYTVKGDENSETTAYDTAAISSFRNPAYNKFGSAKIMCYEISPLADASRQYGDVNNDGEINIKDITLIRYHLAEKATLSGDNLKYADITTRSSKANANAVDSADIFAIRCYILGIPYTGDGGSTSSSSSGGSSSSKPSASSSIPQVSDAGDGWFDFWY